MLTLTLTALLLGSVVAERRRAEARLRERDAELSRAMRFAVAGELASATAHELNQPMTAIVSYLNAAEILSRSPGQVDERLSGTVRKAAAEAMRAADVLHRLRDFYIGGRSLREAVDLANLCATVAATFVDRLARADILLSVIPDPALAVIEADETQMHIVLHNLVANAIDAVETGAAAQRRIEIQWQGESRNVTIAVHDSGPGIDPSKEDQVFEPFVSQKPEGMGLGLAIARTLVRAHGGEITAGRSERLGGARITVRLSLAPTESP
jgi:two-component system sensor kinase FixL